MKIIICLVFLLLASNSSAEGKNVSMPKGGCLYRCISPKKNVRSSITDCRANEENVSIVCDKGVKIIVIKNKYKGVK